jgi:alkaline phosphatase D
MAFVWSALLLLLLGVPGSSGRAAADAQPAVLTHGPLLGDVTDHSVKVWARASAPALLRIEVKPPDQLWPGLLVGETLFQAAHDYTGTVVMPGLLPSTRYDYRVVLDDLAVEPSGSFTTLPVSGAPAAFRFAVGGDLFEQYMPFTILDRLRERQPDFALLLGDLVYSDSPLAIPPTTEAYRAKYRANWADPSFRRLLAGVPSYAMWDDHEIVNDFDGGQNERYWAARRALEEYLVWANPSPRRVGGLYYTFQVGDVDFFVLDTRSYRDLNASADVASKTMLGREQKADLKAWLLASRAPFKVVASSVAFHDLGPLRGDAWTSFSAERAELLDFIERSAIPGVVILSGDQHWSSLVRLDPFPVWEFNATPLAQYVQVGSPASDPRLVLSYNAGTAFGLVEVDTRGPRPRISFNVIDGEGRSQGSYTIFSDGGRRSSGAAAGPR